MVGSKLTRPGSRGVRSARVPLPRDERLAAAAGVAAALATAAVQASGQLHGVSPWLKVGLSVVAGMLAAAVVLAQARVRRGMKVRDRAVQLNKLLDLPPSPSGGLPLLAGLSPYQLGVSPSKYPAGSDPYVPRSADAHLRQALRTSPFVLVVGDSKAGKSRSAYQAALETLYDARVMVPKAQPDAIAELLHLDPPLDWGVARGVVWLDDVDEVGLEVLSPSVLSLLRPHAVIVGTIAAQRVARILGTDSEVTQSARLALRQAERVTLRAKLDRDERQAAQEAYPGEKFVVGIGEPLIAAELLLARFDAGRAASPAGLALLLAAVDMRRAGVNRALSENELRALHGGYLAEIETGLKTDPDILRAGLSWATKPAVSHVAMLELVDQDGPGYRAWDYLVAVADGQGDERAWPLSGEVWRHLLARGDSADLAPAGLAAMLRGQRDMAAQLWERALPPDGQPLEASSARAAFDLGVVLAEDRNLVGARQAYERVMDYGDQEWSPRAAFNLALLDASAHNRDRAEELFRSTMASQNLDAAPRAANQLAQLLAERGQVDEAIKAYCFAANSIHPDAAARANRNLGTFLSTKGDTDGAKAAYQRAINSGHPDQAGPAAFNLGNLLRDEGNDAGAADAFRHAAILRHPEARPMALRNLGLILWRQGDFSGAENAFRQAFEAQHPQESPRAADDLSAMLVEKGDTAGAKYWHSQALAGDLAGPCGVP
jgi:tetratricopeptide (TPR) repeat protein